MNRADFETMVRRMCDEVPPEFLEGVAEVTVSPRAVPHPARAEIYTLGECMPLPAETDAADALQSRVVLYHGSFLALAQLDDTFDWRHEAWETLTHELRHHLEWRARAPDLEAFDEAAEHNFARQEGEPFDQAFYRDGERVADGVYRIDDDYFLEQTMIALPAEVHFEWHGARYRAEMPAGLTLPAYLTVDGLAAPPPGELVVVLQPKPSLRNLFRRGAVFQATVRAKRQL